MANVAATHGLGMPAGNSQPIIIEENSAVMMVISCIPLLGIFPSLIQEISLSKKLETTQEAPRAIELISVKNQYKIANILRELFSVVLIVAGIAFDILRGPLAFGVIGSPLLSGAISTILLTALVGMHIYRIIQNNKVIAELQLEGLRPGMHIV